MHMYNRIGIPMNKKGAIGVQPISIGNDVWISTRVFVLSGVNIDYYCFMIAGLVLTRSCEPYDIIGGVPTKLIKERI